MRYKKSKSPTVLAGRKQPFLALLVVPSFAAFIVFNILPGFSYSFAAFKDWLPPQSLVDAEWVGLKWFRKILEYYELPNLIRNSVVLGLWDILLVPVPLILALACQHCGAPRLKKALDVFSLIPVFIPSVIVVAVTQRILSTEGLLNQFLGWFGVAPENHLLKGEWFAAYYSLSGLWSGIGFPCLVYKANLAASSNDLHSAAQLDGASLLTRIIHIDLPLCIPPFLVNLTMQIAGILSTNTERLLLFKNTANSAYATTLDLYTYELTFKASSFMPSYSKAMAMSLMTMIVNLSLLLLTRKVTAKKEDIYA